jgi:tRNA nucleotidyltransferase (CCA-adding enzyme)
MALLERCDALRKPERFEDLLWATRQQHSPWHQALQAVLQVATRPIAESAKKKGLIGPEVGQLIRQHRLSALELTLKNG